VNTVHRYREFARDSRDESPAYEELAAAVAEDQELLRLLDGLPEPKRQPNLLFAATRYLGGPVMPPAAFRDWAVSHWADLTATMRERSTQTNEPARCATLLPVLAALPQPLALLEVGAAAGLCLYPDEYQYRFDGLSIGPPESLVRIDCAVSGDIPVPAEVPKVVWRAGIDLNPLDVADDDDLRWLESLIWFGQPERVARLRAAARIVRASPPMIRRGDLLAELPALAAQAPPSATLVVFHSAFSSTCQPRREGRSSTSSNPYLATGSPTRAPMCCRSWSRRFGCQRVGLRHLSSPWTAHRLRLPHLMARHCTG
jgi:hypothetical protein